MSRKPMKELGRRQFRARLNALIDTYHRDRDEINDIPDNNMDLPQLINEERPPLPLSGETAENHVMPTNSSNDHEPELENNHHQHGVSDMNIVPGMDIVPDIDNHDDQDAVVANVEEHNEEALPNVEELFNMLLEARYEERGEHILLGELLHDHHEIHLDLIPNENFNRVEEEPNIFESTVPEADDNDDDEEQPENERRNLDENRPLYTGAEITVHESMICLLSICLKHNLSNTCIEDMIDVVEMHCLSDGLQKNNLKKFQKYFKLCEEDYKHHYYCSSCQKKLEGVQDTCETCIQGKNNYFIELPIVDHLKNMYLRKDFFSLLQKTYNRQAEDNIISDVYDGQFYKEWINSGFFQNKRNISLSWYTDGIPVFKSSKISAWPVYITINELPFEERKKRHNVLLLGVWYGDSKPYFNYFFYAFRPTFEKILRGIKVKLPNSDEIIVKGVLLTGVCDLPAKCDCMNFAYFTGKYGCCVCFNEGARFPLGPHSSVQIFPYTEEFVLRTTDVCNQLAAEVRPDNYQGVKGYSALSRLMPDYVRGSCIDRMHAVDGGVVKKILLLLFSKNFSSSPFSLYSRIADVNERLKCIKPPKFIHRMPRVMEDLIHWKASELKNFFFYYSVAVFDGIMPANYFKHWLLLLMGIYILSCNKISLDMIDVADDLLKRFVQEFEELYGVRYSSINIHLLLHLANCVKDLGPLWAYSCYEYENINGEILQFIHGTRYIDSQVARGHSQTIKLKNYLEKVQNPNVKWFCLHRKKQVMIMEKITNHSYSVGKYKILEDVPNFIETAFNNSQIVINGAFLYQFLRLLKNDKLYVSELYTRSMQTSSSAVRYNNNGEEKMGFVYCFIKYLYCTCNRSNCDCNFKFFAVIKEVISDQIYVAQGHEFTCDSNGFIHTCHDSNCFHVIEIDNIITPCVYINVGEKKYFISPINDKEIE